MKHFPDFSRALALGLSSVCLVACDEDVRSYSVANPATTQSAPPIVAPEAPIAAPAAPTPPSPAAAAEAPAIRWTLPATWREVPGQRPMRLATFETTTGERLEISLSRFPGDTGGLLANVNRWRQQVGLQPIAAEALSAELEPLDTGSLSGHSMRLRGPEQHLLGAILVPADKSQTWFVKASAVPAVVDAHAAEFATFVKSLSVADSPTTVPQSR